MIRLGTPTFNKAMEFTLKWEGGYVNDPADPGGETNFGISKRAYPTLDIKNLTMKDIYGIYFFDYWRPLKLDQYDEATAVALFDTAVNVGVNRVRRWLGELPVVSADAVLTRREQHYKDIILKNSKLGKFANGWANRVKALRDFIESIQEPRDQHMLNDEKLSV